MTPVTPFVIVRDTREQDPWVVRHFTTLDRKLDVGDYSIEGLESDVAIERKSLDDLVGTLFGTEASGQGRWTRFRRELVGMRAHRLRAVVVEASLSDVRFRMWRKDAGHPLCANPKTRPWWRRLEEITADEVRGRCREIHAVYGVPVLWLGSREEASAEVFGLLRLYWAHRRAEIRPLAKVSR